MIPEKKIKDLLKNGDRLPVFFIVDLKIGAANKIRLFLDNPKGITISECGIISKYLEEELDKEGLLFDLEVSSPGIDMPFRIPEQYRKNLGGKVEVTFNNGIKIKGVLQELLEDGFQLKVESKEPKTSVEHILFSDIKATKLIVSFN